MEAEGRAHACTEGRVYTYTNAKGRGRIHLVYR